ncbi:MAG: AAA family ATPase [Alphaproteobacteria bacterium GM202ARS2]|nr:AAA family ATPase [Alphaproteobacteria bacterium GM202ARS2]
MTSLARERRLDPVIGREEEIRRTIQVLCRRTKNNPVLIGAPGVGKTAIVEGIAQRIVSEDVPERLCNKRLLSLDVGQLLAGAKYQGQFEERLKAVLKAIDEAQGAILLFIDEVHTLTRAGTAEGSMGAANMLKPALARGALHCIGATTLDEYRTHMEKDAALARRFQPVYVGEPSVEDTVSILRGLKEKYELHHGVRIQDQALVSAATWASRYISGRFLPDKAIDLVDEASARMRMAADSKPEALDKIDRSIMTLKIEQAALKKEDDKASKERLVVLDKEIAALDARAAEMTRVWQEEKQALSEVRALRAKMDDTKAELERVEREGNYDRAGELRHAILPSLQEQIRHVEEDRSKRESKAGSMLHESVREADIASVVAHWTGIPVSKMMQDERARLLAMEDILAERVIGQADAVTAVSEAVRRTRAGLQDASRPTGAFLFLGPSGVGKTELSKALAAFLFDDEHALLRLDMSEYMEKHSVSRMVGAPPGYVGYEQGGALSEAVRRRPYQVILFDEVEKAHVDVFDILLHVLDDGRLTDGQGRLVDFRHTLIILTSNLGSDIYAEGKPLSDNDKEALMKRVRGHFKPEFLNRLDDILFFQALGDDMMDRIVDLRLKELAGVLRQRRIELEVDSVARRWLARVGYDSAYGARPLNRLIQKEIKDPLARLLLSEDRQGDNGNVARVSKAQKGNGLAVTWQKKDGKRNKQEGEQKGEPAVSA